MSQFTPEQPATSDVDLLRAASEGDDAAFHALIDRHAAQLFRIALSLSRNRADAEDILQEAMIGAFRGLKSFAGRSSVKTWLIQIVTRQAHKSWSRLKHGRAMQSIHGDGEEQFIDDPALSVDDQANGSAAGSVDVMQLLQALPPLHREVLVLREVQGLTYEEIAAILNVPRGTVESRLSRARAELRQRLSEHQS